MKEVLEPFIKTSIFTPKEYIGPIMKLCQDKRGIYLSMEYTIIMERRFYYD